MTKFKSKQLISGSSRFLLTGSIIAFLIAFSPYLFYLYEIFPDGPVWENSFFIYESKYYQSVAVAAWTYLGKITPLFLLLIWFFTSKHWWYHAILIPISMYAYQLITAIFQDIYLEELYYIDIDGLIYLAPFFLIILVIVYLVRIQIFDRIYGIDLSELNETNVPIFNNMSTREEKELEYFRQENPSVVNEPSEEYYRKL